MKRKKAAALCALICAALSGCAAVSAEKNEVTFRTVKTEGISAYTISGTEEPPKMIKTVFPEETEPQTSASRSTHHYETTIPETLVGSLPETSVNNLPETSPAAETAAALPEETKTEAITKAAQSGGYARIGESGILVLKREDGHYWGLMPCWGTYSLCESWAENVNEFKRRLPEVNVYQTVIPTSSEFYVPADFGDFTGSQKNKADHVAGLLENVVNVDVFAALSEHLEEPIYARTDHHWQPLGAYYAARAFAQAADAEYPALSEYEKVTAKGYVGSMYGYSADAHLKDDPEEFTLYIPPNNSALSTFYYDVSYQNEYAGELILSPDGSAFYCSFLGSDDRIAKIETDCKNGRTLVIFKESYGNAMVPFLTSSFETIYVCDLRYFTGNAVRFCEEAGATDLLFAVCTFTAAGSNGNYLSALLNQ